jgi:hypothetical protein
VGKRKAPTLSLFIVLAVDINAGFSNVITNKKGV